jgi:hypothetical protein
LRYQTDLVSTGMINAAVGVGDGGGGSGSGSGAACGDPFATAGRGGTSSAGAGGVAAASVADGGTGANSPVPSTMPRASSGCAVANDAMSEPWWFLLGACPLWMRRAHIQRRKA